MKGIFDIWEEEGDGQRLGQFYCNRLGITNPDLFYEEDPWKALKMIQQLEEEGSHTPQSDERQIVQYCPCGHIAWLTRDEIIQKGSQKQLEAIENGTKLDAVILHSTECGACHMTGPKE